jgi:peptidoglycan/LPS O-acetylase OafA/YrhL
VRSSLPASSSESGARSAARLDSLTALRFFAALFIVVFHGWYTFTGRQGLSGAGVVQFGYTSVGFFFVLSGFVLAWSWRPGTGTALLWWRRLVRVFPLCALTTTVVAVYFVLVPQSAPVGMPTWSSYLQCLFLLQAWPPFAYLLGYDYPSWSLSTEMFFYFLFPFLALASARLRRTWLLLLAVGLGVAYVVLAYWIAEQAFYSLTPGSLLAFPPLQLLKFALGVALGTAFRRGWRPHARLPLVLAGVVLLYAAMPRLVTGEGPLAAFRLTELFPDVVLLGPLALLVCAAAAHDLRGGWGFGRIRPLVVLGDWSFALYLVHAPLLMLVNEIRVRTEHLAPPGTAWFLVYISTCIAVAGALHICFEHPVDRWLRQLPGRLRRGPRLQQPDRPPPRLPGGGEGMRGPVL